jgi:hypothetical protein
MLKHLWTPQGPGLAVRTVTKARLAGALTRALVAVILGSCGNQAMSPAGHASPSDTADRSQLMVGPNGGLLTIQSGPARGAQLAIPPGALTKMVQISMQASEQPATNLPHGVKSAGPIVHFQPDGLKFAKPAIAMLPTTRPANSVYTRGDTESRWNEIQESVYNPTTHLAIAKIAHFSGAVPTDTSDSPLTGNQGKPPKANFKLDSTWPATALVMGPDKTKKCVATLTVTDETLQQGLAITEKGCTTVGDFLYFPSHAQSEGNPEIPQKEPSTYPTVLKVAEAEDFVQLLVVSIGKGFSVVVVSPKAPSEASANSPTFSTAFPDQFWGDLLATTQTLMTATEPQSTGIVVSRNLQIPAGGCPVWGAPLYNDQDRSLYGIYVGAACSSDNAPYGFFLSSKNHASAWTTLPKN